MSKLIVRFFAILGALWLIGIAIVLFAVIDFKGNVPSKPSSKQTSINPSSKMFPTRPPPASCPAAANPCAT